MNGDNKIRIYLAALAAVIVMAIYTQCLYPVFAGNDSPETIAMCKNLWPQHPPGYPLHTMIGKIASYIPLANPGFRINLFSALLAALTAVLFIMQPCFTPLVSFCGALILAFSSVFWAQGIEAKGSVYLLNIVLTLAALMCAAGYEDRRKFYLFFFLTGLSLSNHYMSTAALFPAAAYLIYKRPKKMAPAFLLLIIGITPYIFLPLRSWAAAPPRWGDASTLDGFIFMVTRAGYPSFQGPDLKSVLFQLGSMASGFFDSFSFILLAVLPGIYFAFRKHRELFWFLVCVVTVNISTVVLFNQVPKNSPWFIPIYLLPSALAAVYFIAFALDAARAYLQHRKIFASVMVLVFPAVLLFSNYGKNSMSGNLLSYDFVKNMSLTMDKNPLYLPVGDFSSMPFYYVCNAVDNSQGIDMLDICSMGYDFGREDLYKVTGMKTNAADEMTARFRELSKKHTIYRVIFSIEQEEKHIEPEKWKPYGLLFRYGAVKSGIAIFDRYSYRGIYYPARPRADFENGIILFYPLAMARFYNEKGGEKLIKKASIFPGVRMIKQEVK